MNQMIQQQQQQTIETPGLASASPSLAEVAEATRIRFSEDDRRVMRESFCQGASDAEFRQLCAIAEVRGLNPLAGQCHFVQRWNGQQRKMVWAVQVSIDGMRSTAEESGLYDGQDEAEHIYDERGKLEMSKVRVYRKDWKRPAVGVARFDEYAATTKEGTITQMWNTKPHVMLDKCAEAQALRKAFPQRLGGLYAPEETEQSQTERAQSGRRIRAADEWVARINLCDDIDSLRSLGQQIKGAGLSGADMTIVRELFGRRQAALRQARPSEPKASESRPVQQPAGDPAEDWPRGEEVDPQTGEVRP